MFDTLNEKERLEKAIREKFGDEAVQNLKSGWDSTKERTYKEQVAKIEYNDPNDYNEEHRDNFTIKSKIDNHTSKNCTICEKYIYKKNDFYSYLKFNTCEHCYIQYIEGREEKWLSQTKNKTT